MVDATVDQGDAPHPKEEPRFHVNVHVHLTAPRADQVADELHGARFVALNPAAAPRARGSVVASLSIIVIAGAGVLLAGMFGYAAGGGGRGGAVSSLKEAAANAGAVPVPAAMLAPGASPQVDFAREAPGPRTFQPGAALPPSSGPAAQPAATGSAAAPSPAAKSGIASFGLDE